MRLSYSEKLYATNPFTIHEDTMNNRIPALVLALALSLTPATMGFAAQGGGFTGTAAAGAATPPAAAANGGFTGPGPAVVTVQQAKEMRDDSPVTLRGNIVQSLGDDNYLFRDSTGTITVDIDHKKWNGQQIGPEDTVEIQGEVDKDWTSIEVDVERIIKH